ncbi:MAG: hypothetical protein ACFFDD_10295 [Promethearchaeota archaeon]
MGWPSNYPDPEDNDRKFTETSSHAPPPQTGIVKDFKVGFTLAVKNILSFGLAMLGILLVSLVLLVVILIVVIVPVLITMGLPFLIWLVESIVAGFSETSGLYLVMLVLFLILPLLSPFFIALGALFGMSREIVESDGTQAESAFSWYGKRGLSLLGGGLIHALITLAPIIIAFLSISYPVWNPPTDEELEIVIPLIIIWIVLINGMLSLTFPGIIDGLSAIRAAARSVRLTCQFPGRVLGAWFIIVLIIGVPLLPIFNELTFLWRPFLPAGFLEPYTPLVILALVFVVVPAVSIILTRIYMILTAKVDATYTQGGDE